MAMADTRYRVLKPVLYLTQADVVRAAVALVQIEDLRTRRVISFPKSNTISSEIFVL